jgi:hypothetical protein
MNPKAIIRMARPLRAKIGAHTRMKWVDTETAQRARAESDDAVSLAKYLITQLDSRHDAVLFARAVGMPGYINMR